MNKDIRKEFSEIAPEMDEQEYFPYYVYEHFGISDEAYCNKYENGHRIHLDDEFSEDIVNKLYDLALDS